VINTDIPGSGAPWVSPHDQTGLTVPVSDASALAGAARRVLEDPDLRLRLAAAARRRAGELFDHRDMAERSLEIYRRAIAQRTAPGVPAPSRLRQWIRKTASAESEFSNARLASVRGEPVRRH
jgi:rhamnosyl/mannosyltransferase